MKVTKINIGRLYNLGSYEHVRYDLTVEVPPNQSPTDAMVGLEKILSALNPKLPAGALSVAEERRRLLEIEAMKSLNDEEFSNRYLWSGKTNRADYMKSLLDDLALGIKRREA